MPGWDEVLIAHLGIIQKFGTVSQINVARTIKTKNLITTKTKDKSHQKVLQVDIEICVFYQPLSRDRRVISHLPTDKQADSTNEL